MVGGTVTVKEGEAWRVVGGHHNSSFVWAMTLSPGSQGRVFVTRGPGQPTHHYLELLRSATHYFDDVTRHALLHNIH